MDEETILSIGAFCKSKFYKWYSFILIRYHQVEVFSIQSIPSSSSSACWVAWVTNCGLVIVCVYLQLFCINCMCCVFVDIPFTSWLPLLRPRNNILRILFLCVYAMDHLVWSTDQSLDDKIILGHQDLPPCAEEPWWPTLGWPWPRPLVDHRLMAMSWGVYMLLIAMLTQDVAICQKMISLFGTFN